MRSAGSLRLSVVPSVFAVEHLPHATFPEDDEWVALVRAPEGLTVVRETWPTGAGERWVGFYATQPGTGPGAAGVLLAMLEPLEEMPAFVASTYHADLVLVPEHRAKEAVAALEHAGHRVDTRHLPAG
ncbi:ACT domain-containing protein [Bailinhaonella thermotolerans]|uniref:ACT domain-containing protein n=1 Tax=Bailinhaonella thermotolerans TaxID=1070861 RepID=A0A3A4AMZ6_9ACTN|nr:ACT domain-containing protein [Bailinhaonella thermotolerans]RJL30361.1 ACT domain-containing protein [Bailinhaonella thermotolerans]